MTRRRWIADEFDAARDRAILIGEHAAHLARVLRAKIGQEFEIALPGEHPVRLGRIVAINDSRVEFELGQPVSAILRPTFELTLLLAIFKFDRMEWAIEKATELGVNRIVPVIARRSEKHLTAAAGKRYPRWERLARQASEAGLCIVLSEAERDQPLQRLVAANPASSVTLAIGPEGGWTEEELALFAQHAWQAATLGRSILRAETAAVAAVAIVASSLQFSAAK
ncbi:MAG: 16S rRNA methyltransferase [Acidobacteria bacterium]|nr:MAG: 16S rRNA methyltransferase [Acidobacteriota bacterium]